MSTGLAQQESRLKDLISKGREQGYLTYAEVNDHLPDEISDPDQIEDIIGMINFILDDDYNSASDINQDQELDILDIVSLVNIILG